MAGGGSSFGDVTDFGGGVAVVTGAGSGLGRGFVERAVARGMRIALADIDEQSIVRHAGELVAAGVDAIAVTVDVTRAEDLERLAEAVWSRWGRTDLLVNNAGIIVHGRVWDLTVEDWHRVIDVNLNGVFHSMRAFLPRMIAAGERAHIVNVASVAALGTGPLTAPYGASKHACLVLTEAAAHDLAEVAPHIAMTAAIPGPVRTAIFDHASAAGEAGSEDRLRKAARIAEVGMEPPEAAEIIIRGAAQGLLRVFTHPEMAATRIEARSARSVVADTPSPASANRLSAEGAS